MIIRASLALFIHLKHHFMKLSILALLCWLASLNLPCAQELIVIGGIENKTIHQQDSIVVLSVLGSPFHHTALQNNLLVLTTFNPFIFSSDSITSTQTLSSIEGLNVYPNPTPDILVMHRTDILEAFDIDVHDMNGIRVRSWKWPPGVGSFQPSFQSLTPGVYLLAVSNEGKTKMNQYKIVKQ
jgi:hypothetical protein